MSPKNRSLFATLALVASVAVMLTRRALVATTPVGIVLQLLAVLLMLWARFTFGMRSFHATANPTAGGLVTAGPYRYWRHPIYAAVLLFVWAGLLGRGVAPAPIDLALAALATAMTIVRVQAEEQLLRASMPEYAAYAARTRRFIPFVL
jgi:protein-S-isoprenylcysteine O-methyltransferase Ste14